MVNVYLIYGRKRFVIPFFLIILIILSIGYVILKNITPQSPMEFAELKRIAEMNGYEWIDTSEAKDNFILHSGKVYIDDGINIEYAETDSTEHARMLRENMEEKIREQAGGKNYTLSVGRYYKYSRRNKDDTYELVIQIDNTYVFAKVPYEHKKTVLSFLRKINYV